MATTTKADSVLGGLDAIMSGLEDLYRDIHQHPELSMQERRTAAKAAECLQAAGYDVPPGVGNTGVVGLLRNGEGPTVMLRADIGRTTDQGGDWPPLREHCYGNRSRRQRGACHACVRT